MHVLALLVVLLSAPGGRTPIAVRLDYEQLLRDYRHGDAATLTQVAAWPHGELKAAVADLKDRVSRRATGTDVMSLRAAAVLHVEASFALDAARAPDEGAFQRDLGRDLLDLASRLSPATAVGEIPFECSWWLALGYHFGSASNVVSQADSYGQADRACGGRPELWLAHGAFSELLFTVSAGSFQGRWNSGPSAKDLDRLTSNELTKKLLSPGQDDQGALAAAYYRRAARAEPTLWEARLRLARVLMLTGRSDEAAAQLRAVLDGCREPRTRYLAHLFLGDVLDKGGHRDDAVAHYRSAVEIGPSAPSARMALARVFFASGDNDAARAALLPYLERDPAADVTDPWLIYSVGVPIGSFERSLARLRAAVAVTP